MERFLEKAQIQRKLNLFEFVTPPANVTWRSSACLQWLVRMQPLIVQYLPTVRNAVIPRIKHKAALARIDDAMSINQVKGKAQEDFVDYIDDKIRMCLGHLRQLKLSDIARQRLFKKADSNQQIAVSDMLAMIQLPPDAEEACEDHVFAAGEAAEAEEMAIVAVAPVSKSPKKEPAAASGS